MSDRPSGARNWNWTSRASAAVYDLARTVPGPPGGAMRRADRRRRYRGLLGAGVTAVIAVAGCGGSHVRRTESGQAVFSHECGTCHSLLGRQSPRQQGGGLRGLRMPRAILAQFAAEMPVPHPLTRTDRNAVVNYILSIQRQDRVRRPG
jgi:mono/diheme cytochrome c family protein